jgi:hypothetical protein
MHTYRQTGESEWTVGFERTARFDSWRAIMVFTTEAEAASYCAYLNGGTPVAGRATPPQQPAATPADPSPLPTPVAKPA